MSKHTPGQWYWDFDRDGKASLRSDAAGEPIMGCSHYPSVEDRCLIAAAPDLLEACEAYIGALRSRIRDGKVRPEHAEAMYQAECKILSAIARAKGESQ